MGFIMPAFILKNTPELRKKLDELGIYPHPNWKLIYQKNQDYNNGSLYAGRGFYASNPIGYYEEVENSIDCGTNEDLFLAIAALRDDIDKNQWFTDGDKWIQCPEIKFSTYWTYNDIEVDVFTVHKATVNELIKHFKG